MKIALASDHAGFVAKENLKPLLFYLGVEFEDLGTASEEGVDYPESTRHRDLRTRIQDEQSSKRPTSRSRSGDC
jgi:ribose 5-phosphate isomerase RpiB